MTLLVTQRKDTIGEMSCNPSIGGVGKGTLIREIDAMGGLIGRVADMSGIQFKVLNSSKGAAVQGPRAQMDRDNYKKNMQKMLFEDVDKRLELYQGSVHDLIVEGGECVGIVMEDGVELRAKSVVITTGTFLGGMVHIGKEKREAGRYMRHTDKEDDKDGGEQKVEPASNALSQSLKNLNFPVGRLRTGTPPRLNSETINFEGLEV